MTRIGIALGVALLTIGLGAGVFAGQGPGGPGGRGGFGGPGRGGPGGPGRMGGPGRGGPMGAAGLPLQQLDLTSAQKEQVQSIMQSHESELRTLGERAMAAHEALEAASTTGTLDEGLVRTKAVDVAAVESDMAVAHARIYSEIFQILTPEQQKKAGELHARRGERRERMEERRQR
jgi:Spy/CpxP family protein refolding chaperone